MPVTGIDHVAFPTADAERTLTFYAALGFDSSGVAEWRAGRALMFALVCGQSRLNVHPEQLAASRGQAWYLRAPSAEPGSLDICFRWSDGHQALLALLGDLGVPVERGPVLRYDAAGRPAASIYIRDPDGNLLEFMSTDEADISRCITDPLESSVVAQA